ncbi:MAG: autotransporter domain-containing protein [Myxococcales bacterium]|nr:autotransporter domain-containing protein [Myxococcales bacterium]
MGERTTVTCTDTSTAYEPSVFETDDIDLTVETSSDTVEAETGDAQAILLNAGSTITNNGDITATIDAGQNAIVIGDDATIINNNSITGDQSAIVIGNNATITNSGTITGGSDAIVFTGTDSTAINTVENLSGGVITTAAGAAIVGSVGTENINLRDGSTVTGDINLFGAADVVTIESGATVNGNIDLGDGDDQLILEDGADTTGNVQAGNGNDTITLRGSSGGGSTLHGDIDLGDSEVPTGAGERNALILEEGSFLDGSVTGGANDDFVDVGTDATIGGDIDLLGGSDELTISSGAMVNGNVSLDGANSTITNDGSITATVSTHNAIEIGDNATITNSGTITGGSDAAGSAIVFTGTDIGAINTVENLSGGLITTDAGAAIVGSVAIEEITLRDGSTVTGDINLMDGADVLTIDRGAVLIGNIDLGPGSDALFFESGAIYTGSITTGSSGDTRDRVILRGGFVGLGSTVNGDIQLGVSDLSQGAGEENLLGLQIGSLLVGNVTGGSADDSIEIGSDAQIMGAISLGNGTNDVLISNRGVLLGNLTAGDGMDTVIITSDALVTGDIDLGAGDDVLELFINSTVDGSIMLGDGEDTLDYDPGVSVTGNINLGNDNDTLLLRPSAVIPSLDAGPGSDTLHLGADPVGAATVGSIDLFDADQFEVLVVGPADFNDAFVWRVSTSSPTVFEDGIVMQTGALLFDGVVELDVEASGFSQQANSVMVFIVGEAVVDSQLKLTGALTLDPTSPDPMDPLQIGASVLVTIQGVLNEGDYTLIRATGGITGSFDEEILPTIVTFSFSTAFVDVGMGVDEFVFTATRIFTYESFARSASERNTGQYLDDARLNADMTFLDGVISPLDLLPANQLTTALAQLHAESYDAHTSNILSWGRVQQQELQQRSMRCERFQYAPLPNVVTEDPCGSGGFMPWAKVIGNFGQNSLSFDRGYDSIAVGALVGVDYKWNENLWISGSMGYGTIEIDHDGGADSSFKSVDLGIAVGTVRGPLSVRGSFSYSHGFHDIDRDVDFRAARLEGQYDSDRISLALGAGYRFKVGPIVIEPNASIDYSHVEEEAVKEKGNAEIALDLKARQTDIVSGTAGLRFSANILKYRYVGELLEWADGLWMPSVTAQWRQAFVGFDRNFSARMQGAPSGAGSFKSKASDASGGVEVGAHLGFQPMKSANTIEFGYDGFFGGDVTNHSANVSVRIPF